MSCIWKTVPFEDLYEVSSGGKVRNIKSKHIKSTRIDKYGYERVTLYPSGKTYSIHRLVMLVFSPENLNETINHKDGVKTNNDLKNLEWCSSRENSIHRSKILYPDSGAKGSSNPMSSITEDVAKEIKYSPFIGLNNREIGDIFGVSSEVVRRIRSCERRKHI